MRHCLVSDDHRLEITDRDDTCQIDGVRQPVQGLSGALLKALLRSHPMVLTRETIAAVLSSHHRAPDGINRAVWEIRKDLLSFGLKDVIQVKKGRGYTLGESWCVEEILTSDTQMSEALGELNLICQECADAVSRLRYVESASGVQYVTPPPGAATSNFTKFHEAAWRLVLSLTVLPAASSSLIIRLKQLLFELSSYLAYWRMSTRHEEDEWREEYRQEIRAIMDTIEILVTRIVEGNIRQSKEELSPECK